MSVVYICCHHVSKQSPAIHQYTKGIFDYSTGSEQTIINIYFSCIHISAWTGTSYNFLVEMLRQRQNYMDVGSW